MPVRHWRSLIELRSFNFFSSMWDLGDNLQIQNPNDTSRVLDSTWFGFFGCCCYANDSWMVVFCRVVVLLQAKPYKPACPCLCAKSSRLDCVCALLLLQLLAVHLNQATSPWASSIRLLVDKCLPKRGANQSELLLPLSDHRGGLPEW